MTWDADLYLRFGDERTRPSLDLASRIDVAVPRTVVDLGCGPGNSTQVVRSRWPGARVVGVDNSPDMIAAARAAYPDQEWALGAAEEFSAQDPVDVVFSNAALQWIGDHERLVRHLFDQVAPRGALAFQIPNRTYSTLTGLIDQVARDPAWSDRLEAARGALTMESPAFYYDALADRARALDIWETEYNHVMESPHAIVEWISSTGLRPFLSALETDEERGRFLGALEELVGQAYRPRVDGRVLFEFRRLFVIAYR